MIVQSDFLTHWKTRALGNKIGREAAIVALLHLWGHCEKRKMWEMPLTPEKLAGICDYSGPENLLQAMLDSELLDRTSDPSGEVYYEVHEWGKVNASLVGKWHAHRGKGHYWHARGYLVESSGGSSDQSNDTTIGWDRIGEEKSGKEELPLPGVEEACEESISSAFDKFWKQYPNKVGKADAIKSFRRQKLASKIDIILTALEIQISSEAWQSEGGKYIPHPTTWLNRGGWEDELKPASGNSSTVKPATNWPQKNGGVVVNLPVVYDERMREPDFDWRAVMREIYAEPDTSMAWGHVDPVVRKEVVAHWAAEIERKKNGGAE